MAATYHDDDDLPPEDRALSAFLRQRAAAQGCLCRPGVTVAQGVVQVEHAYNCPALRHPSAASPMN